MKSQISRQPKMQTCREKLENCSKTPNSFSVSSVYPTDIAVQFSTELSVYKVFPASRERKVDTTIKHCSQKAERMLLFCLQKKSDRH